MTMFRVRMRFAKDGDLRWISHRDLVRTFERMFRRAGIQLGMTQGFHPRAKLTFPSALALGVAAVDEVMEFLLAEEREPAELQACIQAAAPPGLTVRALEILTLQDPKAVIRRVEYHLPLPAERTAAAAELAANIQNSTNFPVEREDGSQVDLRSQLEHISVEGDVLRMTLSVDSSGGAKPTDILRALQLSDLLQSGRYLTRTKVEIKT